MVKGVTGKVILVKVDLSKFENNAILYQVHILICWLLWNFKYSYLCMSAIVSSTIWWTSVMLTNLVSQKGFCQAYGGVSRCLECSTVTSGDFPASRYCRFLEFRK